MFLKKQKVKNSSLSMINLSHQELPIEFRPFFFFFAISASFSPFKRNLVCGIFPFLHVLGILFAVICTAAIFGVWQLWRAPEDRFVDESIAGYSRQLQERARELVEVDVGYMPMMLRLFEGSIQAGDYYVDDGPDFNVGTGAGESLLDRYLVETLSRDVFIFFYSISIQK
jgi:hypothetical protein